jgi:hypothetical protein
MKKEIIWMLVSCLMLASLLLASCTSEISPEEKASNIIGLPIPLPTYFPKGYKVTSVEVEGNGKIPNWEITVTIDNAKTINAESESTILMDIRWLSTGLKIKAEKIKIGDRTALVFRYPDYAQLLWIDSEGRQITLTGNSELQFEELVRMAESVTTPPAKILEARLDQQDNLVVLRGDSRQIKIQLQNNSIKTLKVSVSQEIELPEGIEIEVPESPITMKPGKNMDIEIEVKVDANAPSPTWLYRPVSYTLPKDEPPPADPITEAPYYRLVFRYKYEAAGLISVQDMLSTRLRIELLAVLPPGMVTLQEAEEAADFPVAMLLPSYLPEIVSPPPIGYGVSIEEPHSITVFYSALRVVLSPEPGVSEVPESIAGERTIIRTKQVVIGEDRIDWWAYDIHFSVISDEVPISELKLVAESMMLVGPYSGSWLGIGP